MADQSLRIAVTGARGRLGAALCRECAKGHTVLGLTREDMDLASPTSVRGVLEALDFDVLINTAAYTTVDACEADRELAYDINAHAAGAMAEVCRDRGARMIQVSTDFVFDGYAEDPYREEDATNPINVYGQSKLLGEAKVLAACRDAVVTRVSWVFGPDKPGFPEWLIGQAQSERVVSVPGDKIGCPTYSLDYALLVQELFAGELPEDGVFHLCNAGAVSWFDYASYIVEVLRERGVRLAVEEMRSTQTGAVGELVARRPLRSALDVGRFEALRKKKVPDWRLAVRRYLAGRF